METDNIDQNEIKIDDSISIVNGELIYRDSRIRLTDISAIRFGWLPIRLDMYRIGGRFVLEVKGGKQKMKINMSYYFGIFANRTEKKFNALLNAIWDDTVGRLVREMIDRTSKGESVQIGKCQINDRGVLYKDSFIPWSDLSYQKYYNRLTLNSKSNSSLWTNLYYTETDNVQVLMEFLDREREAWA